jgi:hypothetical protein
LSHEFGIHADQVYRQRIRNEFLFNFYGIFNDGNDSFLQEVYLPHAWCTDGRQSHNAGLRLWKSTHSKKLSPGIKPRFFSQKMEQNEPEKKIPSTAAKAISLSEKVPFSIQRNAHSAFFFTQSIVSIAWKRESFSLGSFT